MFSLLPLLLLASPLVQAADLHHRDLHMKRLLKMRAPSPQDTAPAADGGLGGLILGPIVGGAAPIPSLPSDLPLPSSGLPSDVSLPASSASVTPSASLSPSLSVSPSSVSESSSAPPEPTSETFLVAPLPGVSTVIAPGVTRTSQLLATETSPPPNQLGAAGNNSNQIAGTTLTIIIAVAASVGGIAILWTIFRKWKLSSSKEFDRRLNPIDWQPTNNDDDVVPNRRRLSNASSFRSGSGHGHAGASNHGHSNPFDDFDSPTNSAPVGGYADLARGPSPQMQENARGPTYNPGYNSDAPVPLHHQGYSGGRY